jgi:hypothetical protein
MTNLFSSSSSSFQTNLFRCLVVLGLILFGKDVVCAAADASTSTLSSSSNNSRISYVIEPFETMGTMDGITNWTWGWWSSNHPSTTYTVTSSEQNKVHGNHGVMIQYDDTTTTTTATTEDTSTPIEFGWIQYDRPHNCYGADYVSIWVKHFGTESSSNNNNKNNDDDETITTTTVMTLTLYNDLQCIQDMYNGRNSTNVSFVEGIANCSLVENLDSVVIMERSLQNMVSSTEANNNNNPWMEWKVPISDIPSTYDIRRIKGWKIQLLGGGQGSIIVDQLACYGNGRTMMGAAFNLPIHDMELAITEQSWMEEYYESNRSENYTTRSLTVETKDDIEDGVLSLRYMVEQKETWGE